jgi:predicted ester cyclase
MGIEGNKEIVRIFTERFGSGDNSVVDELLTEDFILHGLRYGGGNFGKDVLKKTNEGGHTGFPDYALTTFDMIAEGDKVMSIAKRTGTHTGEFVGIPPTGNPVTIYRFWLYRIENGKIVEMWGMDDTLGQFQQLGVIPSQDKFIQAYLDSLE